MNNSVPWHQWHAWHCHKELMRHQAVAICPGASCRAPVRVLLRPSELRGRGPSAALGRSAGFARARRHRRARARVLAAKAHSCRRAHKCARACALRAHLGQVPVLDTNTRERQVFTWLLPRTPGCWSCYHGQAKLNATFRDNFSSP